jgi:NAD(P)-dependent dehydrogenase (short-subunit alcohol dehydrogenase family)
VDVTASAQRIDGRPLTGQAVVVAGASRGIGAACAHACAAAGAQRVVLLGRTREQLERVAARVRDAGAEADVRVCDLCAADEVRAAIAGLQRLDTLVISAGVNRPQPFLDVTEETFDLLTGTNLRAAFFTAQAAARRMRELGRGGAIVAIGSQMGHVGAELRSVYCATKHGVEGLTKALAVELAPDGIRVLSVAPTFVRTEMTAAQLDDPATGERLRAQIPLGRFGTPEEVAAAVVFAASPAASLMTGSSLLLDGGWTAR